MMVMQRRLLEEDETIKMVFEAIGIILVPQYIDSSEKESIAAIIRSHLGFFPLFRSVFSKSLSAALCDILDTILQNLTVLYTAAMPQLWEEKFLSGWFYCINRLIVPLVLYSTCLMEGYLKAA